MKTFAVIIAAAILALGTACSQGSTYSSGLFGGKTIKGSNNYVTKDIRVDNFSKVSLTGGPHVTYTQKAGKPQVEVYTSDNIVELLDIYVQDGTLNIGFKKNTSVSYDKLEVRISSEALNGISVAGSGSVTLSNGLKTNNLKIAVAGSGDIKADNVACSGDLGISIAGSGDIEGTNISCTALQTSIAGSGDMKISNITATSTNSSISGSGDVTLSGTTQEATYKITGSGNLFASDLQAKSASANVTGSGEIKCHATNFLKARTTGSGSVGYKGNPQLDYPKKGLYKL